MKPHIHLSAGQSFERVIVCGSPERAEQIAGRLEGARPVAKNREYHTYQGTFRGVPIQVTSHGVGAAGAAIAFQELIDVGAQTLVRIGTAGALQDVCGIGDVVVPWAAARQEGVTRLMVPLEYPAVPDPLLSHALIETLRSQARVKLHTGVVVTSDLYYPGLLDGGLALFSKAGAMAVEMECSALFVIAQLRGVRAASVLSLDGNPLKWQEGVFDPSGAKMKAAIQASIDAVLETLARA